MLTGFPAMVRVRGFGVEVVASGVPGNRGRRAFGRRQTGGGDGLWAGR